MATAEAGQPRYAPDDPTLPKPWKGLICGSTGTMYYWNPETNTTQYEKPVTSLTPPLPPGQPPLVMPTTQTLQSNGISQQQIVQNTQQLGQQQQVSTDPNQQNQLMTQQQQGMQMSLNAQQQAAQMAHRGQQQGPQYSEGMQQQEQLRQQMLQQPGQRMQQTGQQTPQHQSQHQHGQQFQPQQPQQMYYQQPGQQISQPQPQGQHIAYQQSQQYPSQQGQQYPPQQAQQGQQQYPTQQSQQFQPQQSQQFTPQQNQQFMPQQNQQFPSQQSQQFPSQQSQHMGFPPRDETEFQPAKPSGFSAPQIQQTGSSLHNLPTGTQSAQAPKMGSQAMQQQQFGNSSANAPQSGIDSINWQQMGGSLVHNHMGPAKMPNQQPGGPSIGLRMGYGEDPHGRDGNGYFNVEKEGSMGVPQQPKLAAIPIVRNQQDMRISQNVPGHGGHAGGPNIVAGHTGGPNSAPGHAMPHMYNHPAAGPPFPNSAPMRQPPRTLATSDVTNLSAAELYRRQHDVIATGDNVPAPFMTFEATGFPPEILREVRYLLQKRSICRTLPCYMHTNTPQLLLSSGAAECIVGAFPVDNF